LLNLLAYEIFSSRNWLYHGIPTIRSADLTCRDDQLVGMNRDALIKEIEHIELMTSG